MGTLINDCDQCFFDSIASELNHLTGTDAVIYVFQEEESEIDPLWGEEITTVYKKDSTNRVGIDCQVYFRSPDRTGSQTEEGYHLERRSIVEIAAKDLRDRGIRRLRQGDIIYLTEWDQYYDIVASSRGDGMISDSGLTAVYRFDVVRRTKGVPENIWRPGEDG
jgi:hypothetical protein